MVISFKEAIAITALSLAFLAGWWTEGPHSVKAQQDAAGQLEVRTIAAESAFILHYPALKKAYVYQAPFVGSPNVLCTYTFTLSTPGGPITREQCKQ